VSAGDAERRAALAARFAATYGRPPALLARAPGRVNLIGEHTDYNGLPVLPLAIDRSVLGAGAPRADRTVRVASMAARFTPRQYEIGGRIAPDPAGDWGNYHKAAAQGLVDALGAEALCGGDFLIAGDVPPGAGLSSSSALVVGSLLALLAAANRGIAPVCLAELAAAAERYVGTQSGGMDQAVCLLARAGHALRIDFDPLRTRPVAMPAGAALVVCHSLVDAEKSGAARAAYNRRVAECRLACRVLEHRLGVTVPTLGAWPAASGRPLSDAAAELAGLLPDEPLSLDEIAARGGVATTALRAAVGDDDPVARYAVVRRARHVCSEAARVDAAEAALAAGDWPALGALMRASHASCRDDYEISVPALEQLVDAATAAGAIGARLTGAGFGGCTITLVAAGGERAFIAEMTRRFYAARPAARQREHCFVVVPSTGASVEGL
jgi:galactokinase